MSKALAVGIIPFLCGTRVHASPCELHVDRDRITIADRQVTPESVIATCVEGVHVSGEPDANRDWSALRNALVEKHILFVSPLRPIDVDASLGVFDSVRGSNDLIGDVFVRVRSGGWWVAADQPLVSLKGNRYMPTSGFRNLHIGAGAVRVVQDIELGLGLWLLPATASSEIAPDQTGVAGDGFLWRRLPGHTKIGIFSRAGRHDDWVQLDRFDVTYIDVGLSVKLNDLHGVDATLSGGAAQFYTPGVQLVPHGEAEVAISPWLSLRIVIFGDSNTTNVLLGGRLGLTGEARAGGWRTN